MKEVYTQYMVNIRKKNLDSKTFGYSSELDVTFDSNECDFVTDLIKYLEENIGYKQGMSGLSIVQRINHANSPSFITFKQLENANGDEDSNGQFKAEYNLTITCNFVRVMTSSVLSRLFRDAAVSDQNIPDSIADNLMWFDKGIDDTIDQFLEKYPDITEPSSFPGMLNLSLILNGDSLDLPLTSNIADALQSFLRAIKTEV
ncbi:hypothetical protein [Paenibacillus gallinarum]|uniref:Uncharacterized protein n=1 Tax=Paenibacillus gallinarum TaxID=2762232 RepID=A0ABR8T3Q3_9BACL|nr:hypothetical protein [Paenibacillus gallinarum]MBD7970390.1 hypothetical protein [Paenibacillus gallinarum]